MGKYILTFLFIAIGIISYSQEICDNGIDDDGNGLIDLNDPDCDCDGFGTPQTIPSLIPNPSFEDKNCCPTSFSQLNCAETWQQATSATSDYFNSCDYESGAATDAGISAHSGDGYVGAWAKPNWKEYIGSCLLSPLEEGESYTLSFFIATLAADNMLNSCSASPSDFGDIEITIFGTESCSSLPVSTHDCPTAASSDWFEVGSQTYSPSDGWGELSIDITPSVDINAIIIGPPCGPMPSGYDESCGPYFIFDDLILASNTFFNSIDVEEIGSFCSNDLRLEASTDSVGGDWQWYKDGVALAGETSDVLEISSNGYTAGDYQVRYTLTPKCETVEHTVGPPQSPVADFDFSTVCENTATTFTDQSTFPLNGIVSWEWDYDNDNVYDDVGANPSHTFPTEGVFDVTLRVTDSVGCQNETTQSVQVFANPEADFNIDSVCLGLNSSISDLSTINTANGNSISNWDWDFDNGQNSNAASPTQSYNNPNTYDVKLVVTSNHGCKDSTIKTTMISPVPIADFNIDSVCLGSNTSIQELSTVNAINGNSISSWNWNLDDGNTSSASDPQNYLYANSGIYDVQLIVTTNNGCKDTVERTTEISPVPEADFVIDSVCLGTNSNIQNTSSINTVNGNSIVDWDWDFDDGNTDNSQNPSGHLYANENIYDVQLIATSNNGCSDTITKTTAIYPNPEVDFNVPEVCLETPSVFSDGSTVSNAHTSNQITDWDWDFNDGNTANSQNPTHTYAVDNVYNVVLTVTTNHGCSDTDSLPVTVYPNPSADFDIDSICQGGNSEFQDLSSINTLNGDQITDWNWDFDDGQSSNNQNPTHLYGSENLYDVQLLVESNNGCKDSITKVTAIYPNPVVDFSPTEVCLEFDTHFMDESTVSNDHTSNSNVDWDWDFDDGYSADVQNPVHTYQSDGIFDAVLTVTTNHNCVASKTIPVTVYPKPEASFTGVDLEGCAPVCPTITSTSTINNPSSIENYKWELSDGTVYEGSEPSFSDCYDNKSGDDIYYGVTLTVTSDKGCIDYHSEPDYITVYHNPIANFYTTPNKPDVIDPTVEYHNTSQYADFYNWTIENYGTTGENSPTVKFPPDSASYVSELIASTNKGCTDTARAIVRIFDRLIFYVPNTFTPDNDNFNEMFQPVFTSGFDPQTYTLYIFNRWGELIFESHDTDKGWDGTYGTSSSKTVKDGTYIWKIEFKTSMNDERKKYTGHVNLLK